MKLRFFFSLFVAATAAAMTGCGATGGYNLPPASRLMEPGPGVGGPGPGVMGMPSPGVAQAAYSAPMVANYPAAMGGGGGAGCVTDGAIAGAVGGAASMHAGMEVQVLFARPEAMQVYFGTGDQAFVAEPMITPARQNFVQGGVYRLKVTGLPDREATELYPTLEIGPPTRMTAAYLAHNAIPIQFTEEDFDQVLSGNFVTKVIYLPEPDFQELALAGVETLVSTRLDPGVDPIVEADRRGSILAVVRIGNKDMEVPGSGGMNPITTAAAGNGVSQVGYDAPGAVAQAGCVTCGPGAVGGFSSPRGGHGPGGLPPGLVGNGQYGMPISGTPIGLPGPPHIPLGVPAGLQKHVMKNWTSRHIPDPVSKVKINVKQRPGLSYPQPPNRAWVIEDTIHSAPHFGHQNAVDPCADGSCGHPQHGGGLVGGLKKLLHH